MLHLLDDEIASAGPVLPLLRLWALRMLVLLDGHQMFLGQDSVRQTRLASRIGFDYPSGPSDEIAYTRHEALKALRQYHAEAEAEHLTCLHAWPVTLDTNLTMLAELAGLTHAERLILGFTICLHTEEVLDEAGDCLGSLNSSKLIPVLADTLGLPTKSVAAALRQDGKLARTGLVSIDHNSCTMLRGKLDLLSRAFADQALTPDVQLVDLLRGMVNSSPTPVLTLADYPFLDKELSLLLPYLRQVLAQGRPGANIFLHGCPGTGKSELVRAIANHLNAALYEISCDNDEGDPVDAESRLRAYRCAQGFFGRHALLLFDEVEDVFNDRKQEKSTAQTRKAWMNRMLESNRIPTFWVSNSIHGLDPAFLRRFDLIIELDAPPKAYRRELISRQAGQWLDADAIGRLAESADLSPAILQRCTSVVASIANEEDAMPAAQALEMLVHNTLKAQRCVPPSLPGKKVTPPVYDPRFICADADLAALAEQLQVRPAARLCLYGPPGTGKTAFGRWLASELDRPLLVKRGSDLLSKWLGGTEQLIAEAFREAEENNAVLLIDEVDSFLQDRRRAQHSWEVTQVNELLTQLESYEGLLIASTNLMDDLDTAAMRRFDLKVRFDYLQHLQAAELLRRYCVTLGLDSPGEAELRQLARLRTLTPGDFAVAFRQSRFAPLASSAGLLAALERECRHKETQPRGIGFIE